jgi:hypothetical protein
LSILQQFQRSFVPASILERLFPALSGPGGLSLPELPAPFFCFRSRAPYWEAAEAYSLDRASHQTQHETISKIAYTPSDNDCGFRGNVRYILDYDELRHNATIFHQVA